MSHRPFPVNDLLNFLEGTQIFQGLDPEQLAILTQIIRPQSYRKGEPLFQQGDKAEGFFIVRSGSVKVFKHSANGREQILHIFGAGDHFAEVPAFDGQCFPAFATAIENSEILFFPRQFFLELLEQHPTLTINLLKSFARHLRRFSVLVDNLSLREVPGRLAAYLLQHSNQVQRSETTKNADCIELEISKGQLAALLGTIPETLSRAFHKLSQDGSISIEGTTIHICDRLTLEKLAK